MNQDFFNVNNPKDRVYSKTDHYGVIGMGSGGYFNVPAYMIDINSAGIERAQQMLRNFPTGWQKAVGSAIKRAARHGETVGYRIATERYAIGSGILKQYTRYYNTVTDGGVKFGYKGNLIPLMYYDVQRGADGKLQARVLRKSPYKRLNHAFISKGLSYNRIRERLTPARFPTAELFGPSAVNAIEEADDETGAVENAVVEEFDKRIDHEIEAILNGWRIGT